MSALDFPELLTNSADIFTKTPPSLDRNLRGVHRKVFYVEMSVDSGRRSPSICCSSVCTLYDNDVHSETPAYAVVSNNLTQVRELAAGGAYGRPSDAWMIYQACLHGDLMIQALSANEEIDLNPVVLGQMGDRVFHFLLRTSPDRFHSSKLGVIKKLLQLGIDPLEPDHFGNTALHIVAELPAYQESMQLMDLLLGEDTPSFVQAACLSNIDRRNGLHDTAEIGNTALHVAILRNNEACVKRLLESGASTRLTGLSNETPLSLALQGKCTSIVHLLLEHGAVTRSDVLVAPEMIVELSLWGDDSDTAGN